jgi:hypothetical protein
MPTSWRTADFGRLLVAVSGVTLIVQAIVRFVVLDVLAALDGHFRGGGHSTYRRYPTSADRWLTLALAVVLGSANAVAVALPVEAAPPSLPQVLYAGGASDPTLTPAQAREAVRAWWPLRLHALATDDLMLTHALEGGPAVQHDDFVSRINLGYAAAGQITRSSVRMTMSPIQTLSVVVPRQDSLPAQFLAQVTTTAGATGGSPGIVLQDLLVFARSRVQEPWRAMFEIAHQGSPLSPLLVPDSGPAEDQFAMPASRPSWMDPATIPGLLAAYWQSWRDTGHPPASSPFADGYDTNQRGQLLAGEHNRIRGFGIDDQERFSGDSNDAVWQFSAVLVSNLYCFTIRGTYDERPSSPGGLLRQPASRLSYGGALPPGRYSRIVTERAWETCALIPVSNEPSGYRGPIPPGVIELVGDPSDEDVGMTGSPAGSIMPWLVAIVVLWGAGCFAAVVVLLWLARRARRRATSARTSAS